VVRVRARQLPFRTRTSLEMNEDQMNEAGINTSYPRGDISSSWRHPLILRRLVILGYTMDGLAMYSVRHPNYSIDVI
jgi:hypothetical protein